MPREALKSDDVAASTTPWWKAEELVMLLRQPAFLAFLLAAGGIQAAHATFLTFATLIWQKQGLSGGWIGGLWAIGVFAEIIVFAVSGWLVERFGAVALLICGAALSVAVNKPWDEPLDQILHGVTYGASHIGAIHFIGKAIPLRATGSAQALYATVAAGVAMGFATIVAGWLYARYGGGSYAAMAVIAVVALAASLRLNALWSGRELSEPSPIAPVTAGR